MDARLAGLKRPQAAEVKPSIGDIKDYLSGRNDLSQANMDLNFYSNIDKYDSVPRTNKTEKDVVDMLNELQRNKEDELKNAIDQEEFNRKYQGQDYRELELVANQKRQEADVFGAQGNDINAREQSLKDEVAKLEADLVQREAGYAGVNDYSQQNYDNLQQNVRKRETDRQIQSYAEQRAANIAKVKTERARLEQERALIKQQLGGLEAEGGGPTISQNAQIGQRVNSRGSNFRANQAAQRLGSGIMNSKPPSSLSNQRPNVDQDLKARLVYDQQRINDLKRNQQSLLVNNPVNQFDDVDILQRELNRQPNYYNEVQKLTDDYSTKNVPKRDEMLGDIRRQLEEQSAAPRSVPQTKFKTGELQSEQRDQQYNKGTDNDLLNRLDDLEGLLVKKSPNKRGKLPPRPEAKPPAYQQPAPQPYPQYAQPQYPGQPIYQQPPPQYLVPQQPQDQYFAAQQQQQFQDPTLNQFAQLIQTQSKENNQLKEVLENFGKTSAPIDQLDGTIDQATQQLLTLKNDPKSAVNPQLFGGVGPGGLVPSAETAVGHAPQGLLPFPDDFAFRQNEARTVDLEREERAVMSLQSQEYDQLRILQRLDKNSDLYELKLKQFKELSSMRAEAEKVMQEQRIEKLRRDFEREKQEDDRALQHQLWLENQKRAVLEGRINGPGYQPPPQPSVQQIPSQDLIRPQPTKHDIISQSSDLPPAVQEIQEKPSLRKQKTIIEDQVMMSFDYGFNIPKSVRSLKVVSSIFKGQDPVGDAQQAGPTEAEIDLANKDYNKIFFDQKRIFKEKNLDLETRIVFELQAVDPVQQAGFVGIGWTWINLVKPNGQQIVGSYTIPIYAGSTNPLVTMRNYQGRKPPFAPGVCLTLRISKPGDDLFDDEPISIINLRSNPVPPEHQSGAGQIVAVAGPALAAAVEPQIEDQNKSTLSKQPTLRKQPTIKKLGRDPDYLTRGIQLNTHFLVNKQHYKKLTLRMSLHHGGDGTSVIVDDIGQVCEVKTPSINDDRAQAFQPGELLIVYNNKVALEDLALKKNYADATYARETKSAGVVRMVEFQNTFDKDLHKLYWDDNGDKPIVLLVEAFGKADDGGKKNLIGYSTFELLKRSDGKIKYGFYQVPLNKGPAVFDEQLQEKLPDETVGFSIIDPDAVEPEDRPGTALISDQFIPNFEKQMTLTESFLPTEAIDIYVDGTRHLPDNTSIVKCKVHVVDSEFKNIIPAITKIAMTDDPKSTLRNQQFNMKVELRGKQNPLKATAIVFILLTTFDKSTQKTCILGTSYFPLFLQPDGMPANSDDISKHAPHLGQYQMPLYNGMPKTSKPFDYEKFIYMDRVPTSSILVRVHKAPKDEEGDYVEDYYQEAPEYRAGVYRTQYFPLTDDERDIMALRRKRLDPKLEEVALQLLTQLKSDKVVGEERDKFLQQAISINAQSPVIDLNYFSQYEPTLGFRINVEAVHNNQTQGFFATLATMIPPGNYYTSTEQDKGKDSFIFLENDHKSRYCTIKFDEEDSCVTGFAPADGMCVLLDIRVYLPDQDKFQPYGYAVLPLLFDLEIDVDQSTEEFFVGSGLFSLVVYKGAPNKKIVEALAQKGPALTKIKAIPNKTPLDETSLIVRLVDTQRKTHFLKNFEQSAPSLKYIDQAQRNTYRYKVIEDGFFSGYAQQNTFKPAKFQGKPKNEFNDYLLTKFKESMNL